MPYKLTIKLIYEKNDAGLVSKTIESLEKQRFFVRKHKQMNGKTQEQRCRGTIEKKNAELQ